MRRYPSHMKPLDVALATLATLRLTRFVTTDKLGDWMIVRPLQRAAFRREPDFWGIDGEGNPVPVTAPVNSETDELIEEHARSNSRVLTRLSEGVECPFCVGFWVGAVVLGGTALASLHPATRTLARSVLAPFALNYVTAHLAARLDH